MKKYPNLSKYCPQVVATWSWKSPIASISAFLTVSVLTTGTLEIKCLETATSASRGHLLNQSIVQQLKSPGNFNARVLNFSPT